MALFGASDMTRGVVASALQSSFHINYALLGLLFSASSLGYLLASFASGFVVDHFGMKAAILGGLVILTTGLAITVLAAQYNLLAVGFVCSGVGGGTMELGSNALVPHLAGGGEQSSYFNVLHALYGVGACAAPLVVGFMMIVWHQWRLPYVLLLLVSLGLLIPVLRAKYPFRTALSHGTDSPAAHSEHPVSVLPTLGTVDAANDARRGSFRELWTAPALYVLMIAISVYVAAEVGVATWLPTLLHVRNHLSISVGALYLSLFYLLYTLGRFAGSVVVHRFGTVRSITVSALLAAVFVASAQFGPASFTWCYAASGLFFGTIFPTISAVASESFPERTGTVLGLLFGAAGVGAMAAAWLIGVIADHFGLQWGFALVLCCLLLTTGAMVGYAYMKRPTGGLTPAATGPADGRSGNRRAE